MSDSPDDIEPELIGFEGIEVDLDSLWQKAIQTQEELNILSTHRDIKKDLGNKIRRPGSNFITIVAQQQKLIAKLLGKIEVLSETKIPEP